SLSSSRPTSVSMLPSSPPWLSAGLTARALAPFRRRGPLAARDRALQRLDEVDHLRTAFRLFAFVDLDRFAGAGLLLDHFAQRIGIAVAELLRLERAGLALDELDGEIQQFLVRLLVRYFGEIGRRLAHFVGKPHGLQHQPVAARLHCGQIFMAAHDELADAKALGRAQSIAEHRISFLRN